MLSPPFGYSASHPASPGDMEVGDFDQTPAPSARPSVAALRSSSRADAFSDTPVIGRTGSYRHHLLKTSTSGAVLVDTDISAPPILSRTSPPLSFDREPTLFDVKRPENRPAGGKKVTTPPRITSPSLLPKDGGVSPDIPASQRVCLDPALHVNETHADVHHPGLLKGADFCDLGAPSKEIALTNIASTKSVSPDGHGTPGHSRMVKVRPAFNYYPMHDIANHRIGRGPPFEYVSKVKSYRDLLQLEDNAERSAMCGDEDGDALQGGSLTTEKELPLTIPISDERPFRNAVESITAVETPRYFDAQEKVRPLDEGAELDARPFNQESVSKQPSSHGKSMHEEQILKRYSERNHAICDDDAYHVKKTPIEHEVDDCSPMVIENGTEHQPTHQGERSLAEHDRETHDIDDCVQEPVKTHKMAHSMSRCVTCAANMGTRTHSMEDCVPFPNPTHSSTASTSRPAVNEVLPRLDDDGRPNGTGLKGKRVRASGTSSLESGSISRGAMQWLRDILKYPESNSFRLTKLPPKKRVGQCPMSGDRRTSEPARLPETALRKLTSESEPGVDETVFRKAVQDLQKLLDNAMALACQAVDQPLQSRCCDTAPAVTMSQHAQNGHIDADSSRQEVDQAIPAYQKRHTFAEGMADDVRSRVARPLPVHQPSPAIPHRSSSKKHNCRVSRLYHGYCAYCHSHSPCSEDTEAADFEQGLVEYGSKSPDNPLMHHASVPNVHLVGDDALPERDVAGRSLLHEYGISLKNRSHVSLRGIHGFNFARSHKRKPIARDWSPVRKRFVASVACISTALIGIILGIYAGLVPKIQYYILDESFAIVHGNTGCFLGLAIPTFFFWPLPLLHGRKPYILGSLGLAMPLLFPQALSVYTQRLTDLDFWRSMLLVSRAMMGCALGFASMNFHGTLTDLFGASLMSSEPHEEVVDHFDARRHGGGMGVWLGIWTWCWLGSLSVGFLVGASIIDQQPPAWGFFISIILLAVVLVLNVISPEVRRSPYRRSVTEVWTETGVSRRLARGEVMMHRVKTGPKWWGEEVYHGVLLSMEMMRQPGFAIMSIYVAWIYAQIVLLIILLGSLSSRIYRFTSPYVGLHVACLALGALFAIPFQKANMFSRSRQSRINSSRATLEKKVAWTTHLARRTAFTILLPIAGGCYAAVSSGPPLPISAPTIFATYVGFLSSLAVSECNGIIMETFDTSDLSPGMTGRQRGAAGKHKRKKTNYSSFPRVTAGYAVIHTQGFVLSAGATALGGHVTRTLGQQVTTAIVAAFLFLCTVALLLVLARFKTVQVVPRSKSAEMARVVDARRKSLIRLSAMPNDPRAIIEEEEAWQPVMIGNPSSGIRRINILELGSMSRWQEIRKRNQLIDEETPLCQRVAISQGLEALDGHIRKDAQGILRAASLRGRESRRGRGSHSTSEGTEMGNLRPMGHSLQGTPSPYLERDGYFN